MANPFKVINNLLGAEEEIGAFIAGPDRTGIAGAAQDGFRHRCREFANLPGWARALSGVAGGSINRICTPYWDDNGWDGPTAQPGFPGGQCEGLGYLVTYEYNTVDTGGGTIEPPIVVTNDASIAGGIPGPINGIESRPRAGGTDLLILYGSGQETIIGQSSAPQGAFRNPRIISTTPFSGVPDECGDKAPELVPGPNPPPNPGPLPGPEPTNNPDPENPIPFIPIPPFNDPVFGPQPFTGPDENPGGGPPPPPAGGDGLPGDGGAIGPAAGEVDGDEPGQDINFGPPPPGRIWVGCIVDITVDSRIGNIPGTGPASTVWPSVRGNVALKYSTLFGSSQRINSRYTELFRPNTALTVTGCFLQVQPGGSGLVFPISALTCPENPCEVING